MSEINEELTAWETVMLELKKENGKFYKCVFFLTINWLSL